MKLKPVRVPWSGVGGVGGAAFPLLQSKKEINVIKRKLAGVALVLMASSVMAAGPYDGVYVNAGESGSYLSVHSNNGKVIATLYGIIPASGIVFYSTLGNVYPTQLNTWDLLSGSINGASATLTGQVLYNACNIGMNVNFAGSGANAVITSASQTAVGRSSGMNCAGLLTAYRNGLTFTKAF